MTRAIRVRDLADKTAFVSGGASGIGAATARALRARGAAVAIADLDRDAGELLAEELGPAACFVELDVSDPSQWAAALAAVVARFGSLDVLCLNAGVWGSPDPAAGRSPLDWLTVQAFDRATSVNLGGTVYGLLAALPHLRQQGGSVVVTSSVAGLQPYPPDPVYAMTKHALIAFTRSIAPSLAELGITMSVVCPGSTDTQFVAEALKTVSADGTVISRHTGRPLQAPHAVARVIVDLVDSAEPGDVWLAYPGQTTFPEAVLFPNLVP